MHSRQVFDGIFLDVGSVMVKTSAAHFQNRCTEQFLERFQADVGHDMETAVRHEQTIGHQQRQVRVPRVETAAPFLSSISPPGFHDREPIVDPKSETVPWHCINGTNGV
jgi:hypothetical protein